MTVYEYTLSTEFDVSTALMSKLLVFRSRNFPYGLAFNTDRNKNVCSGASQRYVISIYLINWL